MDNKISYSEKLKDPRWQRKRLEIMQRDNFTCQHCKSITGTLHIHHKYYISGLEPWDYDERALITLCEICHKAEEEIKSQAKELLYRAFCNKNFLAKEIIEHSEYIDNYIPFEEFKKVIDYMFRPVYINDEFTGNIYIELFINVIEANK